MLYVFATDNSPWSLINLTVPFVFFSSLTHVRFPQRLTINYAPLAQCVEKCLRDVCGDASNMNSVK